MEKSKWHDLWKIGSNYWYMNFKCKKTGDTEEIPVGALCFIRLDGFETIWRNYETIRSVFKEVYLVPGTKIGRYEDAAILIYAINISNPLFYIQDKFGSYEIDPYFLKQRLALFLGLCSFAETVEAGIQKFLGISFPIHDSEERENGKDDFFTFLCKDLFHAAINRNYNLLTMTSLLKLIIEYSALSYLTDGGTTNEG